MTNATNHPSRWLGAIPLIVSAGALFVFFSGFYVHGLSIGLGVDVHQHLTVSDYAGIAIAVGSDPLVFIPVLLLVRFITLAQEVQKPAGERQPAGAPATRRASWMLAIVIGLAISVVVLPLLLSLNFPEPVLLVVSFIIAVLVVVVVGGFLMALLHGVRQGDADPGDGRDEQAVRASTMRKIGVAGAGLAALSLWPLIWLYIRPELDRFPALDLPAVLGLLFGVSMTWIFLIDRSYGYRPLRRVTSDLLRTAVSLGPAVLFVYWFIGFHDARDLRNDIGSIAISTRAGATMDSRFVQELRNLAPRQDRRA